MEAYTNLERFDQVLTLINSERYSDAVKLSIEILSDNPQEISVLLGCSGTLIDAGTVLNEIEPIEIGSLRIQKMLETLDLREHKLRSILEYNLSNGYASLANLANKKSDFGKYKHYIQKQKICLQNVLLRSRYLDKNLLTKIMSNYGNLLLDLGRFTEAIDYLYKCIELDSKHAVAMCNCSSALQKTLNLSSKHNYRIMYEFWRLMHEASKLPEEMYVLSGNPTMYKECTNSLLAIETYLSNVFTNGIDGIKKQFSHFDSVHSWEAPEELEKIRKDRFFLTANPTLSNCIDHYRDDICFEGIVTKRGAEGEKQFQKLVNIFNNIKEDFATARFLYYKSISESEDIVNASASTYYIESSTFSDFGLRTGLLKTSFRLAADLLDKCACFISFYLELEHQEDKIYWNNFWYKSLSYKKGWHSIIEFLMEKNPYLSALKDLHEDLYRGIYPASVKDLRNSATHNYLILNLYGRKDLHEKSIDYDTFEEATHLLLGMIKAVIIYLVGFVHEEEKRRELERSKFGEGSRNTLIRNYKVDFGLSDRLNET